LSLSLERIDACRKQVYEGIKASAERMKRSSTNNDSLNYCVGTIVSVIIPPAEKSHKLIFNNVIGRIHECFPDIAKYKILTASGLIKDLFTQNDLQICNNLTVNFDAVSTETEVTFRSAVRLGELLH